MIGSAETSIVTVLPSDSVSNLEITAQNNAREEQIRKKRERLDISDIWYHFWKSKSKEATCDYCKKVFPKQTNSATNAYWNHLRREHLVEHNKATPPVKNKKPSILQDHSIIINQPKKDAIKYVQKDFEESICNMIVKLNLSFRIVDQPFLFSRSRCVKTTYTFRRRLLSKEESLNNLVI
jgi:hypothetical protein